MDLLTDEGLAEAEQYLRVGCITKIGGGREVLFLEAQTQLTY